ncbi:FKBP-type peptidyl-prolyl cis-trans isomerase [Aquabacterium sp.]|uniref:FKBP-type peptidyl-prolyl cis-trans isomerase n=1 Tax=Aquabacterium sp. TaxID=1872578 RepID=UPI002BBBD467|nr:peptidylprolyl isomerase [Aquabacterium sp.]HSW03208.1 peptidylprolyl isomerase [Aquabacterium sp.]
MLITDPCVVSLTWTLADGQGQAIDELTEPLEFFFGGDDLLPKLEEAIAGQEAGFETDLYLEPEHAFGDYRAELVCFEDRSLFPEGIEEGMQFDGLPEGAQTTGMPPELIYTLTEIYPSHVVLDGNHPLAGVALQLQVKVIAVREASEEEVEARSVAEGAVSLLAAAPPSPHLH